jgi:hypothetical protein
MFAQHPALRYNTNTQRHQLVRRGEYKGGSIHWPTANLSVGFSQKALILEMRALVMLLVRSPYKRAYLHQG